MQKGHGGSASNRNTDSVSFSQQGRPRVVTFVNACTSSNASQEKNLGRRLAVVAQVEIKTADATAADIAFAKTMRIHVLFVYFFVMVLVDIFCELLGEHRKKTTAN